MYNFLRRLDLNLLVTLDALLTEHSVTRAAKRLHLSQPSVSIQLSKLRGIFNDPLLLPAARGMIPTARADALRPPLRQALDALGQAIMPSSPFDPAKAIHTWRISASDYGASTVIQPALANLRLQAPYTRLALLELTPTALAHQMEQGEIDLALCARKGAPLHLHQRCVFNERYVLTGRHGHPHLHPDITVADLCRLEHAIVSRHGAFCGVTDIQLDKLGLKRNVALSVPHFLFLAATLTHTDLVAFLPERLARRAPELQILEPPFEIPSYDIMMLWHERAHRDPAHQWLRDEIVATAQSSDATKNPAI